MTWTAEQDEEFDRLAKELRVAKAAWLDYADDIALDFITGNLEGLWESVESRDYEERMNEGDELRKAWRAASEAVVQHIRQNPGGKAL